jgi:hypothetical protein
MLSLNARFTTISPAQYQRINQVSLLILIASAALAPAWVNIAMVGAYAIMNFISFKQLIIGIIERVLGERPAARQAPVERYPDIKRSTRPSTGNTHKYLGDGLYTRYGIIGRPGRRRYRKASRPEGGIKYE